MRFILAFFFTFILLFSSTLDIPKSEVEATYKDSSLKVFEYHRKKDEELHETLYILVSVIVVVLIFLILINRRINQEKRKFQYLLKNATDCVHILDKNGNIVMCSDSFASFLGYSKEELVTLNVKNWDVGIIFSGIFDFEKMFNETSSFQTKHRKKDGRIIDVRINTKSYNFDGESYLYCSVEDISEKLKYEKSLKDSQKIAKLFNFTHFIKSDQFIYSPEFFNIFELSQNTKIIRFSEMLKYFHIEDCDKLVEIMNRSHEFDDVNEYTFRIVTQKGNLKYINATWKNTYDLNKKIFSVSGIMQDITERYLLEEEKKNHDALIQKQSRLALQGEMLNMIAHQWRQPLNELSILTQMFIIQNRDVLDKSESTNEFKIKSMRIIQKLSETINNFSAFYKEDNQEVEVPLETLFLNIDSIIKGKLEFSNIRFEIEYNELEDFRILTYKNQLIRVIIAIVTNSIEAIEESLLSNHYIKIINEKVDDKLNIIIEDNAGGIPKENLEYVVDPYYTTKSNLNGGGMGLYMSKMVIEKNMNGEFKVTSQEEVTKVTISLPLN